MRREQLAILIIAVSLMAIALVGIALLVPSGPGATTGVP